MRLGNAILALTVVGTAIAGCRTMWLPTPPMPVTHQSPGEQLVFMSDFRMPEEHRLIRELKAERDDVATTLDLPVSNEQIYVYLFADADKYSRYLKQHFPSVPHRRAFFIETDTRLAVYAHWSDRMAEDLRHEVAHGYLHASVPALPLWIDEGLAEYFEVPRSQAGLNPPHLQLLKDMIEHNGWQPDLLRLERLTSAADMQQIDYAESWAWVYFLLNAEPERRALLTSYLAELRDQGRTTPISERIASRHFEPQRTLAEYLTALNSDTAPIRH